MPLGVSSSIIYNLCRRQLSLVLPYFLSLDGVGLSVVDNVE